MGRFSKGIFAALTATLGAVACASNPAAMDATSAAGSASTGTAGASAGTAGAASEATGGSPSAAGSGTAGGSSGTVATSGSGGAAAGASNAAGAAGVPSPVGTPGDPCPPAGTPCAIMPLGDSITAGAYSSNMAGYRSFLFRLAKAHAQSITFVGTQTNGPEMVDGMPFPMHHEGHGGYVIETTPGSGQYPGIASLTPDSIATNKPNIVLLMIGTNDVEVNYDLPNAPKRFASLVNSILAKDDKLLLVVAKVIPTKVDAQNLLVQAYNTGIAEVVKGLADAGKHVVMVDMYSSFTSNANYQSEYLSDKLHPNDVGHSRMADTWYAAIGSSLR